MVAVGFLVLGCLSQVLFRFLPGNSQPVPAGTY
jgi:hypothetical protein